MTAINRKSVRIAIAPAGTNPSTLTSSDFIKGQIRSYGFGGGDEPFESEPLFGGYVDLEQPQEQVEVNFEFVPNIEDANRWDALFMTQSSSNPGTYIMGGERAAHCVFIEATKGSFFKSWGVNNARVTTRELNHEASNNQEGNLTLAFSPEDEAGISNFMTAASAVTALPVWTSL